MLVNALTGIAFVVAGTPAATPAAPVPPVNAAPVALILVAAGVTSIAASAGADLRGSTSLPGGATLVDAGDTTPSFLATKLGVTGLISKSITNPAGTETLTLSVPAAGTLKAVAGTATDCAMTPADTSAAIAALAPASPSSPGFNRGLKIQVVSVAAVSVTADTLVLTSASGTAKLLSNVSATIATGTAGAGGLDTGSIAASAWYAVWVIAKADGTAAAMLSLSATAPTMPNGYIYYARYGWVRTASGGGLLGTIQRGRRAQFVVGGPNVAALPLIASGVLGSGSTPTWVSVSLSALVPTTAVAVRAVLQSYGAGAFLAMAPNTSYGASNSTTNPPPMLAMSNNNVSIYETSTGDMLLETPQIAYVYSNGGAYFWCWGWEDAI